MNKISTEVKKKTEAPSTQQSLDKALGLLVMMAQTNRSFVISEIETELGVSRPTAYTMLNSMVKYNFLEKDIETGKYSIGFRPFTMGTNYPRSFQFLFLLEHYIKRLHEKWKCRVNITVFKPPMNTIKILSYGGSEEPISRAISGSLLPSYASGSGRAMLATLPEEELEKYINQTQFHKYTEHTITDKEILLEELRVTRERGVGMDREELVYGNYCFASAVYDSSYKAIATIGVSCPAELAKENMDSIAFDVKLAASQASTDLGYNLQPAGYFNF